MEGVDEREGWGWDGPSLVDQGVCNLVHSGQCLGKGRPVMVLEEVMIWHGVVSEIADGDGGDDGGGVVHQIIFLAWELDYHAGGDTIPGCSCDCGGRVPRATPHLSGFGRGICYMGDKKGQTCSCRARSVSWWWGCRPGERWSWWSDRQQCPTWPLIERTCGLDPCLPLCRSR